jgi:ADP-ribose pyrophosphatase
VTDLFFYGTLRHMPLLATVLGRPVADLDLTGATLADHKVFWVQGGDFPMIQSAPGEVAKGLLARGLTEVEIDRLRFYEDGFDYELKPVVVQSSAGQAVPAQVFFPDPDLWAPAAPWSLSDWAAIWGGQIERMAIEIMAHYGRIPARQIAEIKPQIRMRAAAWLAARARSADADRDIDQDVVVHRHQHPYMNFFATEEADLQFRRYDGSLSPVVNRGSLMIGEAVVVLPYDPVRDTVLLVEQFRAPVYLGGSRAPWVWEPVAGLMDPGETPEQTAHREAQEEAGLTLSALDRVGAAYSSTGSSNDHVHLYIGLADLGDVDAWGGVPSEGEDIRSRVLSFDQLMQGIDAREFVDMPLLVTAMWLARHHDRLRAMA